MADPSSSAWLTELAKRTRAARSDAVGRLEALVNMESPSDDIELLGVIRTALGEQLTALGGTVQTVCGPDGDHLRASFGESSSGQHVLVVGHFDTVCPAGTLARRPFNLDGDWASGPGTFDMKGALVALELALLLMRDIGMPFAQPVQVVLVCDEEISSPDGRNVVLAGATGAAAVLGLEPPHPNGDLKNGRRGVARIRIDVEGRESHSGLAAADGVSAIDELVDQLVVLRDKLPRGPALSCNVGTVAGGTRANVVAGQASAEIGLRFATVEAEQLAMAGLAAIKGVRPGARVTTRTLSSRPAWQPAADSWLVDFIREQAAQLGESIGARPAGGAGDTNFTGAVGIPTVDGLGPLGHGAHAPDERVNVGAVLRRAALLAWLFATQFPSDAR
jgi:glutamate carboxypeptidase